MHERPSPPPSERAAAKEAKPERLYLVGKIGTDVGFHTTSDGKRVARFRLAEQLEDGSTIWHTVKAYGARAEALEAESVRGRLGQGTKVELVGYLHQRRRKKQKGQRRTVAEIYVDTLRHSKE